MKRPSKTSVLTFLGGAAAAIVAGKFVKSKAAHDLAVRGVVGALKIEEAVVSTAENIRAEAVAVYNQARETSAGTAGTAGTARASNKEV
jgi:hypothetical protein